MEKTETLRRTLLSQFYRKNRFALSVAVFSALLSGTLNLMISWIMQQLIDLISGEAGALSLKTITLCCAGLGAVIVICYMINYCAIPRFMRRALVQYKNYAFCRLLKKRVVAFQSENSAAYLSALTNDVSTLETDYLVKRISMIVMAVNFFGALAMMLWYSPLFTAVAAGLMLLPLAVSLLTGSRMKTIERRVSDCNAKYTASLKDCLSGFAVVKSFHAEREIQSLYDADNRALEDAKYTRRRIGNLINLLGTLAGYLAQIGVVLVGGYLAAGGRAITPGVVLAFTNLMNFLIQPVAELPTLLAGQKSAHALTEKLAETLQKGDDLADGGETATLCDRIELRDVSFGYEAEHEILHGVSTVFEHGKSYAIVGGSGSGKSTLLNLVMGSFSDYTGTISYDGTELHALRGESLVALTSVIQQNVFTFDASIRDNITMFRDFPQSEVDEAMRRAHLTEMVERCGADFRCGENGKNLSGGEKQRISIARSLLKQASLLVVDEATAALDAQTAHQVSQDILSLCGVTRIVVTHTLDGSLLRQYDEILVLKDGCVSERGTFDDLLAHKGYFYALYTVAQ